MMVHIAATMKGDDDGSHSCNNEGDNDGSHS